MQGGVILSENINLKEVKVLRENERQKITLTVDENNNKYIKHEIYSDKRDIYKTLQKINHPNIPKIFDIKFDESTIVIEEYIEGNTLGKLIDEKAPLSKKLITSIAKQLVSAMEALHNAKIIHRDIKPDNIIINASGHIWVIDYNISRFYRDEVRKDTEIMGTFGYAPIEQFGMMPTDYKSDIYSFGATLKQLLNYAKIKGGLYKIANKSMRLDPVQRYKDTLDLKRSFKIYTFKPILLFSCLTVLVLGILIGTYMYLNNVNNDNNDNSPQKEYIEVDGEMVEVDEEIMSLLCFSDFKVSDTYKEYSGYGNFNSTFIFNCEDYLMHLSFMEDMQNNGTILMGKNNNTPISTEAELNDGVFSLSLKDSRGNSFSKDFEYTPIHSYRPLYTKNKRVNAEMVCWDMDGDNINELLVGICDCSFTVENKQIYMYFNYSQAWCIKYDEARGFVLCDGDMFSENSKFALINGDLRVHLPVRTVKNDDRLGYELEGDILKPFY